MTRRFTIGLDGGTEGLRAVVYDLSGNELAFASAPYPTEFPQPGYAEQNPEDWWAALKVALPEAVNKAGIKLTDTVTMALDTTCCTVCSLNRTGKPLRSALLWMDIRAENQAKDVLASGNDRLKVNNGGHGPVSAEWMIPKALWLKENQPDIYDDTATICEYQDYLNYRLTGRMTSSANNTGVRWHFQPGEQGPPTELLAQLDASELLEKWPQTMIAPGGVIGTVLPDIAEEMNLPTDTQLVQGGADAFIAMAGLGVVSPGQIALVTGSSHLQLVVSDTATNGHGIWGAYGEILRPSSFVIEGGQTSTGSAINWFRRTMASDRTYAELDAEAKSVAIGSDGICVQDHFQGNRTPYTDATSRGCFTGLSLTHTRGHLFRALLESIAFGSRLILETMNQNGILTQNITACGGVTRSEFWTQMHADIMGLPIKISSTSSAPALGSAIFAAIGAGMYRDLDEATDAMVHIDRIVEPDMQAHAEYAAPYARYKRAYLALKEIERNQMTSQH